MEDKNTYEHEPESKHLLNKNKLRTSSDGPQFFCYTFTLILKVINIALTAYIAFTTALFFLIHYYGDKIFQSKLLRIEYDTMLYYNLFLNTYFIILAILGFITIQRSSMRYFSLYYLLICFYSSVFLVGYLMDAKIFYITNEKIFALDLVLTGINTVVFTYLVYYVMSLFEHSKRIINKTPVSNIIHEVNLRIDMMKMMFNSLLVSLGLGKVLRGYMYKKDSYYFTSLAKENFIHSAKVEINSQNMNMNMYSLYSESTNNNSTE